MDHKNPGKFTEAEVKHPSMLHPAPLLKESDSAVSFSWEFVFGVPL